MNLIEPLVPKNPATGLRVISPARISRASQDPDSNTSQHEDAQRFLDRVYSGSLDIRRLSDQASGWRVDRECMEEAKELIASGEWDLVIVGELRELYRNPKLVWEIIQDCMDSDTRFISIADNIDTADENWEMMTYLATLRHGMVLPELRRRIKRKATHTFSRGGMVLKVKYGYRKLSKEEAATGKFGPQGLRIVKVPEANEYLHRMRILVLRGVSYERIADWLNDEGVPPGPYVTGGKWTGRLVIELLRSEILSGCRQFRTEISKLIYRKGKNKPRLNPKPPEMKEHPELAHFTPEEHRELIAAMDVRKAQAANDQSSGKASPLYDVPRARSLWPGQHARCHVCGGLMYVYGEFLKCQNALGKGPRECWNHVLVRVSEARDKVLPVVLEFFDRTPAIRRIIVQMAWSEYQRVRIRQNRSSSGLDEKIAILENEKKRLLKAIRLVDELESLAQALKEVDGNLSEARAQRLQLSNPKEDASRYNSSEEIAADLDKAIIWLAETSRDFADILRRLIPKFVVYPVQALDTPQVHPRARITISSAAWLANGEAETVMEATLDLFEPPDHIKFMFRCFEAKAANPEMSLRQLGAHLNVHYMTVKRCLAYHRLMQAKGLAYPFRELDERPANASRWNKRKTKPFDSEGG